MNKTKIEYLDYTWNPITMRCSPVSEACKNCWHLRAADRLKHNPTISDRKRKAFAGLMGPYLDKGDDYELGAPARLRKPSIIGVQFMGDLFHESVPFEMIDEIWTEMTEADQHTYLVLTKRPERLLAYHRYLEFENTDGTGKLDTSSYEHPKHIWLGVTVENQAALLKRVPVLLEIEPAVHFISAEPLLEYIDPWDYLVEPDCTCYEVTGGHQPGCYYHGNRQAPTLLDWVTCGAETGPGARPMSSESAVDLYHQCKSAGVPFFFKKESKGLPVPDYVKNTREFPK